MESRIVALLLELGIPIHLRGFDYLKSCILMCVEDMSLLSSVTKLLYPEVGKLFHIPGEKVERAIRNAIEVSWECGDIAVCTEIFGYSSRDGKRRPTNSEYIAGIAVKLLDR